MHKFRIYFQFAFLIIFFILIVASKSQIWMVIVFLSIMLASIFGRFYCGWICPINTIITPIQKIKNNLAIGNRKIYKIFISEIPRYILFALFLFGIIFRIVSIRQGKNFPLPIIVIAFGIIATLIFNVETWHRYLCPWGIILSISSRFSKFKIDKNNKCVKCKKCVKVCPGKAITKDIDFEKKYCLLCYECVKDCPVEAIDYKK